MTEIETDKPYFLKKTVINIVTFFILRHPVSILVTDFTNYHNNPFCRIGKDCDPNGDRMTKNNV